MGIAFNRQRPKDSMLELQEVLATANYRIYEANPKLAGAKLGIIAVHPAWPRNPIWIYRKQPAGYYLVIRSWVNKEQAWRLKQDISLKSRKKFHTMVSCQMPDTDLWTDWLSDKSKEEIKRQGWPT